MVKRLVLIPHQRSFHREEWVWMRAGMRGLTPPARIEQVKHWHESVQFYWGVLLRNLRDRFSRRQDRSYLFTTSVSPL